MRTRVCGIDSSKKFGGVKGKLFRSAPQALFYFVSGFERLCLIEANQAVVSLRLGSGFARECADSIGVALWGLYSAVRIHKTRCGSTNRGKRLCTYSGARELNACVKTVGTARPNSACGAVGGGRAPQNSPSASLWSSVQETAAPPAEITGSFAKNPLPIAVATDASLRRALVGLAVPVGGSLRRMLVPFAVAVDGSLRRTLVALTIAVGASLRRLLALVVVAEGHSSTCVLVAVTVAMGGSLRPVLVPTAVAVGGSSARTLVAVAVAVGGSLARTLVAVAVAVGGSLLAAAVVARRGFLPRILVAIGNELLFCARLSADSPRSYLPQASAVPLAEPEALISRWPSASGGPPVPDVAAVDGGPNEFAAAKCTIPPGGDPSGWAPSGLVCRVPLRCPA
jgi:hypothetical protein